MFRVLSRVLYSVIDNYVCIEYLCCPYTTLIVICCDNMFKSTSYNELIGIWNSRSVNEPYIMPWICEEKKYNCNIIITFSVGELPFIKRVRYSSTQI